MTALEDLNVLLQNIPNSSNVVYSLEELRTALTAVTPSELAGIVPQLSFSTLFQYLDTDDSVQLECCCDILKRLLHAVLPSVIITNFKNELITGLHHNSQYVVELCLTQILRVLENDAQLVVEQIEIVETLVKLLPSEQPGVSTKASSCLAKLGVNGYHVLFGSQILSSFKKILERNDVVRYRVYEVVVKIIAGSPDSIKYFENDNDDNLLDTMISEISPKNSDVLGKMTVLEFASDLVACPHGFNYLERKGFVVTMETSMEDALNDPFLSNGYMKFFGCLCFVHPDLINSRFRNFTNAMFSSILKKNLHTSAIAVESLGIIGSSPAGKLALSNLGQIMSRCLPVIGQLVSDPPIEMRLKALEALQHLLEIPDGEYPQEILPIMEAWFHQLFSSDPVSVIVSVCQQPFPDLKTAAFSVLKCLAKLPWGQVALKDSAGFLEYLLDRRSENSREGALGKYEIVQILLRSPFVEEIFGTPYFLRLVEFRKKGPYYSPAIPQVALDDE